MAAVSEQDAVANIAMEALRERLRENIRAEFEKVAQEVIDAAVEQACGEFQTRLWAMRDMAMDRMTILYSVERIKK